MTRYLKVIMMFILLLFANFTFAEQENVYAFWKEPPGLHAWNMDVRMKPRNAPNGTFFAHAFDLHNGGGGYIGFQRLTDGKHHVRFSMWKLGGGKNRDIVGSWGKASNCEPHNEMNGGVTCFKEYNWKIGQWYKLRVTKTKDEQWFDRWTAWVIDPFGHYTQIGYITVANKWRNERTGIAYNVSFLEDFNDQRVCKDPGYTVLAIQAPTFNVGQSYSPFNGISKGSRCTDKVGFWLNNNNRDLNYWMN